MTSPNWKFSSLLALCERNTPVTGGFPSQRPVTRSFDGFFLICAWTNGWANNREAGELGRNRGHYDVTVMRNPSVSWFGLYLAQKLSYISTLHLCVCELEGIYIHSRYISIIAPKCVFKFTAERIISHQICAYARNTLVMQSNLFGFEAIYLSWYNAQDAHIPYHIYIYVYIYISIQA